jgi:CRISPR-associated protein Cas2
MTVVVTRDVADRYRGFLASAMLEIAPGVYTAPRMTRAVRERIWAVIEDWFLDLPGASIVMTWKEPTAPGGQAVVTLGLPRKELAVLDGIHICRATEVATPA